MTPLFLLEGAREPSVARLLEALGAVFETRSLADVLGSPASADTSRRALIVSETQLASVHGAGQGRPSPVRDLVSRFRHVLVYPFRGTPDGLRALGACVDGRAEATAVKAAGGSPYVVEPGFAAAGPFAGLKIDPVNTATDSLVVIPESPHAVDDLVSIGGRGLFTRVSGPSSELFVLGSTAVFDVDAETMKNLDARQCFSALVPLVMFLRHCGCAFWQTAYHGANVIIDDLNLRPRYGFVNTRALSGHVDEQQCAVSIAFIPWNCHRASRRIAELFRSRWPRLSVCVHGCDHVGAEFSTASVATTMPMIASSLDRMRSLSSRTGVPHDKVMVFPQGCFSRAAMEALRHSDFLAAVNTELVDHRTQSGVRAGELLKPAITSYGGFPLFLRRKLDEPIENFALDLLLGKPCLVVTHHDDFRSGMGPFLSRVQALNALEAGLHWTNLETMVRRTYSTRGDAASAATVRLLAPSARLAPSEAGAQVSFSKAEPLGDTRFDVLVGGASVEHRRTGDDIVFQAFVPAAAPEVQVRVASPPVVSRRGRPLSYRGKVAARRYLSEFRDNYVTRSSLATAAVQFVRRPRVAAGSR